ncbi:MAG: chromosome segregation protein SMC [Mogibacterium sp.]|nr:chromosome segregation protein SMC [Mogibacterium sp.]
MIRLAEEIRQTEEKLETHHAKYQEQVRTEKQLADSEASIREELTAAAGRLNEHTKKRNAAQERIERSRDSVIECSNKMVQLRAEIRTLENYRTTLEERKQQILGEHESQGEGSAQNLARLEEIRAEFEARDREQRETSVSIEEIADKIISVNEQIAGTSNEIEELTIRTNRAIARRNTIEEMENNYEGYYDAVRQVMQRGFRGIHGTVSELMTVPGGYELAVETALGGAMQNIVCSEDRDAQNVIEWLKQSRAGRVTFLPVSSVHGRTGRVDGAVAGMPGYLGVASEMISFGEEYRGIYEQLLGHVIFADTMDHALRIARRVSGFRIVTLEGEVISSTGAITGGRYRNKTANLLERRKEIEELAARIEGFQNRLAELRGHKEELAGSLQQLKAERAELYQKLQKIEIEVQLLRSEKEHAEELAAAADSAVRKYDEEIVSIEEDIRRAAAMIEKDEEKIRALETETASYEENMDSLVAEADRCRALVEEDNESIVQCRVRLGEQEARILSLNERIEQTRDTITDLEEELSEAGAEHEALSEQRLLLTSTGAESDEKEEILRLEKQRLEEQVSSLAASLDENRSAHEKLLREQKVCSGQITELQDEKYRLEVRTARNETMLASQKDKLWEEFEMSYAEALDLREEGFAITSGNKEAREIRVRMAELGDVNVSAIEEYQSVSKRYTFMTAQEQDIAKAMEELESIIRNMDRTIRSRFKENFDKVVINFEETFRQLFGGGHAELRLENESDPLESGIEIIAQPPGKALKNINLMSGGEKTLTAIALMFAVLKAKPTPFCILDEVEAALDESNIERFSQYLRNFHEVQFALITHQKATMEYADVLYGVTMPEQGISRVLSLKLASEIEEMQEEIDSQNRLHRG